MFVLTTVQSSALIAVATYKFLTISQMCRLGIASKSTLYKSLPELGKKGLGYLKRSTFKSDPRAGRLEDIYYLSRRGVNALIKTETLTKEEIKAFTFRGQLFSWQYFHRLYTLDLQVSMVSASHKGAFRIVSYDRYFDTVGAPKRGGRTSVAKIPIDAKSFIIPDSVAMLEHKGVDHLYLIEIYTGDKTTRVMQQLEKHRRAITLGSPSLAYEHPRGNRVVGVFQKLSVMESVINRLAGQPIFRHYLDHYLFKTLDQVNQEGVLEGWNRIDGTVCTLFG